MKQIQTTKNPKENPYPKICRKSVLAYGLLFFVIFVSGWKPNCLLRAYFLDTDNQRVIIKVRDINDEPPYFINRPLPMQVNFKSVSKASWTLFRNYKPISFLAFILTLLSFFASYPAFLLFLLAFLLFLLICLAVITFASFIFLLYLLSYFLAFYLFLILSNCSFLQYFCLPFYLGLFLSLPYPFFISSF